MNMLTRDQVAWATEKALGRWHGPEGDYSDVDTILTEILNDILRGTITPPSEGKSE